MPELIYSKDGGNQPLCFHEEVTTGHPAAAIKLLRGRHGDALRLAPAGQITSGEGAFDATEYVHAHPTTHVVKLVNRTTVTPQISPTQKSLELLATDEIVIDRESGVIKAGAGITLEQANQILAQELGQQYQVLGADLTSFRSATVGGTFATSGMGPQRIRFADSITAICMLDEQGTARIVTDPRELAAHAGNYGATGAIAAVEMRYVELPREELGFTIPVHDTPEGIASITHALSPLTQLRIENNRVTGNDEQHTWINGIELMTKAALEIILKEQKGSPEVLARAQNLIKKCEVAQTDALLFVSGRSDMKFGELDNLMEKLMEIIGDDLIEYTEDFGSSGGMDLMRDVRESAPTAARTQEPQGYAHISRDHTDIDVQLPAEAPLTAHIAVLQAYETHRLAIAALAAKVRDEAVVVLSRYGHVNPVGYDIHHRVTIGAHDQATLAKVDKTSKEIYYQLVRDLTVVAAKHGGTFRGGEKSAGSEQKIIAAFGGVDNLPAGNFRETVLAQRAAITKAHEVYAWRALPHLQTAA